MRVYISANNEYYATRACMHTYSGIHKPTQTHTHTNTAHTHTRYTRRDFSRKVDRGANRDFLKLRGGQWHVASSVCQSYNTAIITNKGGSGHETTAGGGCRRGDTPPPAWTQKLWPNLYPKSIKHGFSSVILPVILYKYEVNDLDH